MTKLSIETELSSDNDRSYNYILEERYLHPLEDKLQVAKNELSRDSTYSKTFKKFKSYTNVKFRKLLEETIMDLLEGLNTPLSLALAISYRNSQYLTVDERLLDIRHPCHYDSAHQYSTDLQACALFKKSTYLESDRDLDDELYDRFIQIEERNRCNNDTLASRKNFRANSILYMAARIIKRVLGTAPDIDDFTPYFGPGASFTLNSREATIAHKLESTPDITEHALHLGSAFLQNYPTLFECVGVNVVPGNSGSSVPNTYKKKRFISLEPCLNMLLQRNLGLAIRRRLKRVGIDIESQQDFHKFLVRDFYDTMATIDLSDASDSIYTGLVKEIFTLCPDWYALLNASRSRRTLMTMPDGSLTWIELEKFCSQGNGFTFELETLIFYAIAQASITLETGKEGFVSVYGDDTIVREDHAEFVVDALQTLGLTVNVDKTFTKGRFKESCGTDTFDGIDVRPVYFKEFSRGIYGIYELLNRIRQIASQPYQNRALCRNFLRPWKRVLCSLQERHVCYGPEELGDSVIHDTTRKHGTTRHGVTRIKGLSADYFSDEYFTPTGVNSHLSYALLQYDSRGTLRRNALRVPRFIVMYPRSRGREKVWV